MRSLRTATAVWLTLILLATGVGCSMWEKPSPNPDTKETPGAVAGEKEKKKEAEGPPEGVLRIPRGKPPSTICPPSMRGSC